jgi:hypothetical protein
MKEIALFAPAKPMSLVLVQNPPRTPINYLQI